MFASLVYTIIYLFCLIILETLQTKLFSHNPRKYQVGSNTKIHTRLPVMDTILVIVTLTQKNSTKKNRWCIPILEYINVLYIYIVINPTELMILNVSHFNQNSLLVFLINCISLVWQS